MMQSPGDVRGEVRLDREQHENLLLTANFLCLRNFDMSVDTRTPSLQGRSHNVKKMYKE